MKKKTKSVFSIFILLIILLYSCTFVSKKKVEPEQNYVMSYKELYGKSCFNDTVLNMELQIVNSKNDSVSLSSIVISPKIVVRYSVYSCGECIHFTIAELLKLKEKHSNIEIIFLLANVPVRDMHVISSSLFNSQIFRVDSLPFAFDKLMIPYLFRIDESGNVFDMFVPQKELPDKTVEYLTNICAENDNL